MREITDHKVNGLNEALTITVLDEPGPGGASHHYAIDLFEPVPGIVPRRYPILFQKGPIKEAGVNGISQEALLAIVIDRLRCFQAGAYACTENQLALENCEAALRRLQDRTRARVERGVEGTSEK